MTERRILRGCFTKEAKALEEIMNNEEYDIIELRAKFKALSERYEKIKKLDEEEYTKLIETKDIEDEIIEKELEKCREYQVKYFMIKENLSLIENTRVKSEIAQSERAEAASKNRHLRLPKLQLKKFGGNIQGWLAFWAQFAKIHDDECLKEEDKFDYLLQCLEPGSAAEKVIHNLPPSKENYKTAIVLLKSRFGKDEVLIEYYVRELLSLVLKRESFVAITDLYDSLEAQLRALESLGMTTEKYAAMLFPLVESALPESIFKTWERHRVSKKASTKEPGECLLELLAFLKLEIEGEERLKLRQGTFENVHTKNENILKNEKERYKRHERASSTLTTINDSTHKVKVSGCVFCGRSSHMSQDCAVAIDASLEDRKNTIKKKGACFKCLKQGHLSANCRTIVRCPLCKGKHYALLCSRADEGQVKQEAVVTGLTGAARSRPSVTYLQTLVARITVANTSCAVRVLCDSGSQRSYILKECARKLKLNNNGQISMAQELFGGRKTTLATHNIFNISLKGLHSEQECSITVLDAVKICECAPQLNDEQLNQILRKKGIELSDFDGKEQSVGDEIEVLLGADAWAKIITPDFVKITESLVAVKTILGWTLLGSMDGTFKQHNARTLLTSTRSVRLPDMWQLEAMGIEDPGEKERKEEIEKRVLDQFYSTVRRSNSGRYIIKLPWRESCDSLEDNYASSVKRLLGMTRKLNKINKFKEYDDVIQDWLEKNIIERVIADHRDVNTHYLPHRAVFKDSGTTKLRPVFDASNKDKYGNSLNNCLETGPNLIDLIPPILTSFRIGKIGIMSDIERAFLQIEIDEQDRDMLRFLWWERDNMIILRHCRVVFGVCTSPFLLASVLRHLLDNAPDKFGDVAAKLKRSFYVDNCLTSVNSREEVELFITQSQDLLKSAGFNLRGWVTSLEDKDDRVEKVLGLNWSCKEDSLSCGVMASIRERSTRRVILSAAQSIFDPIGFTAPVGLIPKILLQRTWELKLGWDENVPVDMEEEFKSWSDQIGIMENCRIPRRIYLNERSTLHVFVDSSKQAFATCIFLRAEERDAVKLSLVLAKSRVAPLKELTIARLELMAALLGVRLCRLALRSLNRENINTVFWSDSAVTLWWIRKAGQWSTFVQNRVKEILLYTRRESWRHVPGKNNPADLLSRGCSATKLMANQWWKGPLWLKEEEENWPREEPMAEIEDVNNETKKTVVTAKNVIIEDILQRLSDRFSAYSKMVRTIAWIMRVSPKVRRNAGENISSEEFNKAEQMLFRLIQKETFGEEERRKELRNLEVFEDEEGTLRMKARVIDSQDSQEYTYPVILPAKHPIVYRKIEQLHRKYNHVGVQTLLLILRERVWIIRGRKTVGAVIRRCVTCRRMRAKALEVPLPPLPSDRTQLSNTFQITGTDLAGPIILKGGEKGWIVIFTCAVYRAVHLELVTSLSTAAYMQSLRRFIARRGRMKTIYSDNGRNFVGLKRALSQLDWEEIESQCGILNIDWKFNPPTAAWWGGFWERLIRILKELLRKNLGNRSLDYEELTTLLCECEDLMNNRPLTYVSEEGQDLQPLKPNMFLRNVTSGETRDLDQIQGTSLVKRWQYLQKIREELRRRFKREYLGFLRSKTKKGDGEIKVGDIVLVGNDNDKRSDWALGKVISILPGRDGVIRVVKVQTSTGVHLRPVQRLYQLEVTQQEQEESGEQGTCVRDTTGEHNSSVVDTERIQVTRSGRVVKPREKLNL